MSRQVVVNTKSSIWERVSKSAGYFFREREMNASYWHVTTWVQGATRGRRTSDLSTNGASTRDDYKSSIATSGAGFAPIFRSKRKNGLSIFEMMILLDYIGYVEQKCLSDLWSAKKSLFAKGKKLFLGIQHYGYW